MIPDSTIQRIKDAARDNIVDVVGAYIKLNRSHKAKCPFHDEKTASFSVSPEKGIYKCFGCGAGGDGIDFVMNHEGLSFIEALREIADIVGIFINEEKPSGIGHPASDYTPPEKLITGIKNARRFIRKKEVARLCFNKKNADALHKMGHQNAVYMSRYRPAQAQLIAKYTDQVILYPKGLNRRKFFKALEISHAAELHIKIAQKADAEPVHWLNFIITHFEHTKKVRTACIVIIAAIPSGIGRSIETHHFSENWID